MTIMGSAAETDQKKWQGLLDTQKSLASLHCFPSSLYLDSEHWKPDTLVKPEMGIKTLRPELWSRPYQAWEGSAYCVVQKISRPEVQRVFLFFLCPKAGASANSACPGLSAFPAPDNVKPREVWSHHSPSLSHLNRDGPGNVI